MQALYECLGWRHGASAEARTPDGRRVRVTYYEHSYKNFWIVYDLTKSDLCDDDILRVFQMSVFEFNDDEDELAYAIRSRFGIEINAPIWGRGGL